MRNRFLKYSSMAELERGINGAAAPKGRASFILPSMRIVRFDETGPIGRSARLLEERPSVERRNVNDLPAATRPPRAPVHRTRASKFGKRRLFVGVRVRPTSWW